MVTPFRTSCVNVSIVVLVVLIFIMIQSAWGGGQRDVVFTGEDMLEMVSMARDSRACVSPDGELIVYGTVDGSLDENVMGRRPTGFLWVVSSGGGAAKLLLDEGVHGEMPVWSPDGERMAFYYEKAEGWQLAIWDRASDSFSDAGRALAERNYLAPQWLKNGKTIVFAEPLKEPEAGPLPRIQVVESTDERIPGDWFFVNKQKGGLAKIDVETGKKVELLPKTTYLRSFRVSPDGGHIMYTIPNEENFAIIGSEFDETYTISIDGGAATQVLPERRGGRYSWSVDGKYLLFSERGKLIAVKPGSTEEIGYLEDVEISVSNPTWSGDGEYFVCMSRSSASSGRGLYLVSVKDGSATNISETVIDGISQPTWSVDSRTVFFKTTNSENYDEALYGYSLDEQELTNLSEGEESYSIVGSADRGVVVNIQGATRWSDMWLVDENGGGKKRISNLNPQLEKFGFSKPELFHYYNGDGDKLAGLIYKPVGYREGQKAPVITYVYEKLSNGRHRFNARNQIFLNHGYAMLLPDVKIKVGETGTSFVKCAVSAVNAVRAMGFTNDKFAIWGGSFGAYATSFIITQTDIFACAVSRATPPELFRNWASGRDRDSQNIVSGQARMGADPFEARERYIAQSAFFHLDKVNTPVLIMHGVEDYTILFGEGEMMFYALRQLGKEATFVIYNYGDHSLSRGSRADTLDVNRRMLEWFGKYMFEE